MLEMKYIARTANFKILKNYENSQKSQKNFQLEIEFSWLNALVIMENFSSNEVVDEVIPILLRNFAELFIFPWISITNIESSFIMSILLSDFWTTSNHKLS